MSEENVIIISVCSVAGALILLAIFVGIIHWRSKQRERRQPKDIEVEKMHEMTTRDSTLSKPPAYTSAPGTITAALSGPSAPAMVYKSNGFDDTNERL